MMYRILGSILVFSAGAIIWINQGNRESVLLTGAFHGVAHKGTGEARLVMLRNRTRVLRLLDLKTYPGFDLEVCLAALPDAEDNETVKGAAPVCVGPYDGKTAYGSYPVPDTVDTERYRTVVIWSRSYQVNFTTAPLVP